MFTRRVDEIEYLNGNRLDSNSILCYICGNVCIDKNEEIFSGWPYYNHVPCYICYCPICGALYYKAYFDKDYLNNKSILYQICFDDDYDEPEILNRDFSSRYYPIGRINFEKDY